MHRSRAPSIAPGTFFVAQPWADCITNMPGFNLRQAQPSISIGICSLATLRNWDPGETCPAVCLGRPFGLIEKDLGDKPSVEYSARIDSS